MPPSIQDLLNKDREFFTAAEIAPIVGSDPQTLRYMAREMPERLPFPAVAIKSMVKFPRRPFLAFYGYYPQDTLQDREEPIEHES